jgi:TM2 domain-containing membrane protein YozV
MNKILQFIPEAQGEEFFFLEKTCEYMDEEQLRLFSSIYRTRRRDPQNVLILGILGMIIAPGLQRFYVGQIGWGIAFFFTAGFCLIGSIIDLLNYKDLALEYNQKTASEIVQIV